MKQKFKPKLFFGTILMIMFTFSCNQDDFYNEETNASSKKLTVQRLNHSDLQKHPKVLEKLESLNNKKSNHNARMVEVPQYGFIVDTDYFVRIDDESHHGYTFRVYRDSLRTDLENLVLNYNSETQRYDAYLIEYVVDENDLQNILEYREIADFTSKTNITFLSGLDLGNIITQSSKSYLSTFECSYSVTYTQQIVVEPAGLYGGIVWYAIDVPVYTLVDCTYTIISGGGGSGGTGIGSDGGGGGGGTNPDNIGVSPILTTPVITDNHIPTLNKITNPNSDLPFRAKIDEYVELLDTAEEENGVMYYKNYVGEYISVEPDFVDFDYIAFPTAPNTTEVIIHFHHNFVKPNGQELAPVPSGGDITGFAKAFRDMGSISTRNNLTSIVVTRNGLYAFRVTNLATLLNASNSFNNPNEATAFEEFFEKQVIDKAKDEVARYCQGNCTAQQIQQFFDSSVYGFFIEFMNGTSMGMGIFKGELNPQTGNYDWVKVTN